MSTITKEQLRERARQKVKSLELAVTQTAFADSRAELEEELELARIALASLEAEPVCVIDQSNLDYLKSGSDADVWPASRAEMGDVLLYRSATPAPVSVPDERYQHLSELYHAQEKRLFKLAQRIKGASFDKYAYSPSQAIDVLESAIFGEREDECRAAILHGADRPQNEPQNIPENIPATQFEPVADLYGLTSPTGSETSFTFDAVEARDFIDGGWSCQEYVELGRFQEAVSGNSPVIPDGWVAVPVEPTIAILDEFDSIIDYGAEDSKDAWSRLLAAAWIKSLPAAPQQEVK
ncbi:hypothetical protein [Enterobacter hormaechei]|uniref:hypothetical protein n=2 Tax=Enterobacter hormaechei TaxID=158836 RepID=UPI0022407915|nr:hypothetical protein [Enterobacter hormaechei]